MAILRTSHNTWTYDFWHLGRRYRKRFKVKEKAVQAEAKKRIELGVNPLGTEKVTFREASELFIENHARPNKKSWRDDKAKVDYLNTLFGNKKLIDFTPLDIQALRNHLKAKRQITVATINRYHALVKAVFNRMKFWRKFDGYNPAEGVKLKAENNAHIRFLTKEEINLLDSHLRNDTIYPYFIAGLHTGMRRAEICNVRWEHITWVLRDIYIPKTKSGKARHIPMNDFLYGFLRDLFGTGKEPHELVFGNLHPDYISHRFIRVCREIGIKDFRLHDLRHTFASHLVMNGVSIFKVCKWLGHSSVTTTERFYAHLSPDEKREEIQCLNKLVECSESEKAWTNFRQTCEIT